MTYEYDFFVIGAGSGGVRASRIASGLGAKVAVAEDMYLGGTCVNAGCVPKKLMVYASQFSEEFHTAKKFGWSSSDVGFNWETFLNNKDNEIKRLNTVYKDILDNAGVEIFYGRATIKGPHTVSINGKNISAKYILIAVGGWPTIPDFPGSELVITSNEAFHLKEFPKRVLIVGGGYIAVEFAGIFNGLGANVIQLYRGDHFLRGFDLECRKILAVEMIKKGVDLRFNLNVTKVEKKGPELDASLTNGETIKTDCVMVATGRKAKTTGLGLEEAKVQLSKNASIIVDNNFRTSVESIYAIGDVIDRFRLTPVALAEGARLAHHLFNGKEINMSYDNIPTTIFSQPNLGTVGLTEERAKEKHSLTVFTSSFRAMKHSFSGVDEKTFMKLIVNKKTDKVLGAHMVGSDAGELMQGIGIAINMGATKAQFDQTIGIHPTTAEEFVTMRESR